MKLPRARTPLPTVIKRAILGTVAVATVALGMGLSQNASSAPSTASALIAATATWQKPRLTKIVAETQLAGQAWATSCTPPAASTGPIPARWAAASTVPVSSARCSWAFGVDIGSGNGDSMVRTCGRFTRVTSPVPGDVALIGNGGRAPAYHAGIYIGSINAKPAIVAASQTGTPVKIQQWYNRYWSGDLMGYWHFNGATTADSGPLSNGPVRGSYDLPVGEKRTFSVVGWAFDRPPRA